MSENSNNFMKYGEESSCGFNTRPLMRQTFNRFDDKLVAKILKYLTFSEKVLFESVSKQFKRCVYRQQKRLCLSRPEKEDNDSLSKLLEPIQVFDIASGVAKESLMKAINKSSLKSMLEKCPSIESVVLDCFVDFEDLDIIGRYCPRIKALNLELIGLNADELAQFGLKYGHRFKRVEIQLNPNEYWNFELNYPDYLKKFFIHCKNLRQFPNYTHFSDFLTEDKEYLPKLEVINRYDMDKSLDHYVINYDLDNEMTKFELLCDKYGQTLEVFRVFKQSLHLTTEQMDRLLGNICKLTNLNELGLYVRVKSGFELDFSGYLRIIAKKNPNLAILNIELSKDYSNPGEILSACSEFSNLVELGIYFKSLLESSQKVDERVHSFKPMNKLKSLKVEYKTLNEDFLEDIVRHSPNLSKLWISCESEITDKTIILLSRLKSLRELSLYKFRKCNTQITDAGMCVLIEGCPLLNKLDFSTRLYITNKTIETLIKCLTKRPKRVFSFVCGQMHNKHDNEQCQLVNLELLWHKIPDNMTVHLM